MGISTQRGIKNTGFYSQKVFLKKISFFFPRYENDHYISKNTFFNDKRSNDSLFSFENIVIDIDFHHLFYECIPDKVNHLLYFLQNCSLEVPIPNSYVYTGRGVQLWYRLKSASYKLEKEYRMVAEDICHRLDDFISEKVDFVNCIDYAASTNPAGLVRFPFGKNTKVKEEKEKKKKRTSSSYSNLFSYRFRMLTRLREMREDFGEGKRDFYLFAIYCSGMDMSEEERMEAVHAFNQGFTVPLSEKEIEKYLSSARKKEYYISNHWLIETFQITQEEQDLLNLYENKKKNHRECGKRAVITPEIIKTGLQQNEDDAAEQETPTDKDSELITSLVFGVSSKADEEELWEIMYEAAQGDQELEWFLKMHEPTSSQEVEEDAKHMTSREHDRLVKKLRRRVNSKKKDNGKKENRQHTKC